MTVNSSGATSLTLPLWSLGFRPFFLAAGLWSAVAIAIWILMLATGIPLPSRFDPMSWHIHEMLFGFVMAAIAGFLLTAVPNWTGRRPLRGWPLALLVGLWFLGRILSLVSIFVPAWLAVTADLAFPGMLAAVIAWEIVVARNWRNLAVVAPVTVLGLANLLMHLEANKLSIPAALGWRLGLSAVVVLLSIIAGRIVPSFTRNWLTKRHVSDLPAPPGWIDTIAVVALLAGLVGWTFFPEFGPVGLLLLFGGALNLWRLLRWRGNATAVEPLLLVLHAGYLWLAVGVGLLGMSVLDDNMLQTTAIHALTVGAIGTMVLAVMTRTTLGHTGRPLSADRITSLIYVFVTFAAIARVAATFGTDWTIPLLIASASVWVTAFGLFVLTYAPILFAPRNAS
jgi:uncharacterized protein involved in response to NO